jgi:VWFA-related protein
MSPPTGFAARLPAADPPAPPAPRIDEAWTRDPARQSDLLRSDETSTLTRLSKDTGGMLLENSNGFEAMAGCIEQDQRAQYVLAYTSTKPALDGTYRKVSVKVKRKGARPSARRATGQ